MTLFLGEPVKYLLLIGDGMADYPLEELGGKTPLQAARKPHMDRIAAEGRCGLLRTIPEGMEPESDIAIMSILGYDPRVHHTGRGPLEAAGIGVELREKDLAFRCNLVTEREGVLVDYSGGHLSTAEAGELLEEVRRTFGGLGEFYLGVSYRHVFVVRNAPLGSERLKTWPPHTIVGQSIEAHLIEPREHELSRALNSAMLESRKVLSKHPVNLRRVKEGKRPANMLWFWSHGRKPALKGLQELYGLRGAVLSEVTLVKGLGVCAGMEKVEVPGATGYYDTSYENFAELGLQALESHDLVLIHVEAPDEAGHEGNIQEKIRAIENLDSKLLGRLLGELEGDCAIALLSDHPTPIPRRVHVADPVPFAILVPGEEADGAEAFDEFSARGGSFGVLEGTEFMKEFLAGKHIKKARPKGSNWV